MFLFSECEPRGLCNDNRGEFGESATSKDYSAGETVPKIVPTSNPDHLR
jgi:hypothetical protein